MAGGRADGDPAVEAAAATGPHAPGRRTGTHGEKPAKAWNVATFTLSRVAQDDQRQERHERLVEVEEVELLALEHVLDLRDDSGARP